MYHQQEVKVQDFSIFVFSAPRGWTTAMCSATCVSSHDCRTSSWIRTGMTPSPNCSSAVSRSAQWRAVSQIFRFTSMYEHDAASIFIKDRENSCTLKFIFIENKLQHGGHIECTCCFHWCGCIMACKYSCTGCWKPQTWLWTRMSTYPIILQAELSFLIVRYSHVGDILPRILGTLKFSGYGFVL